jgi:hypothetical protein
VGHSAPWQVLPTSPPTSAGQSFSSESPSHTYPSSPIVGLQQYHPTQQVGLNQGQTRSRLASTSSSSHYTQPSLTSLSTRAFGVEQVPDGSIPGALGGGRPIIQNNLNTGRIQQGQPGPSSIDQGIGATEDGSTAGPSGAASQGYYPPSQRAGIVVAAGHVPRPSVSAFGERQEHPPSLSPRTAQRDGKGRAVGTTTASGKGQGVHLDGGQYTGNGRPERLMSPAPPAYTA